MILGSHRDLAHKEALRREPRGWLSDDTHEPQREGTPIRVPPPRYSAFGVLPFVSPVRRVDVPGVAGVQSVLGLVAAERLGGGGERPFTYWRKLLFTLLPGVTILGK